LKWKKVKKNIKKKKLSSGGAHKNGKQTVFPHKASLSEQL